MVFEDPLVQKCESCGEKRPDAYIGVMTRKGEKNGEPFKIIIAYCIDKGSCIDGAATRMKEAFK